MGGYSPEPDGWATFRVFSLSFSLSRSANSSLSCKSLSLSFSVLSSESESDWYLLLWWCFDCLSLWLFGFILSWSFRLSERPYFEELLDSPLDFSLWCRPMSGNYGSKIVLWLLAQRTLQVLPLRNVWQLNKTRPYGTLWKTLLFLKRLFYDGEIFCDWAQTFDCVIMRFCQLNGIQSISADWFRAYLTDRQTVKIKSCNATQNFLSEWLTIKHGVSRKSILGSLLLIIYI